MLEVIGWAATVLFASSYLFTRASQLRIVQAVAAMLWVAYGIAIGKNPIIVANLIVAGMALYSGWRQRQVDLHETLTT